MQFLVVFLIVFFICIFVQIFTKRNKLNEFSNLDNDGYVVKHQVISDNMIKKIRNHWDKNEFKEIYDLIKNNSYISNMKISYAITVCDELDELKRLVNFLTANKHKQDDNKCNCKI